MLQRLHTVENNAVLSPGKVPNLLSVYHQLDEALFETREILKSCQESSLRVLCVVLEDDITSLIEEIEELLISEHLECSSIPSISLMQRALTVLEEVEVVLSESR